MPDTLTTRTPTLEIAYEAFGPGDGVLEDLQMEHLSFGANPDFSGLRVKNNSSPTVPCDRVPSQTGYQVRQSFCRTPAPPNPRSARQVAVPVVR